MWNILFELVKVGRMALGNQERRDLKVWFMFHNLGTLNSVISVQVVYQCLHPTWKRHCYQIWCSKWRFLLVLVCFHEIPLSITVIFCVADSFLFYASSTSLSQASKALVFYWVESNISSLHKNDLFFLLLCCNKFNFFVLGSMYNFKHH